MATRGLTGTVRWLWCTRRVTITALMSESPDIRGLRRDGHGVGPQRLPRSRSHTPILCHGPQIAKVRPAAPWMLTNSVFPLGLKVDPANSSLVGL